MEIILPPVQFFRKFTGHENAWADHYGALHVAAAHAGEILPDGCQVTGLWQHGVFGPWSDHSPRTLTYNAPGAEQRPVWVAREDQALLLRNHGFSRVSAVGMPIIYTREHGLARTPRSLLVMPGHSIGGWRPDDRTMFRNYADEIVRIAPGFSHVAVCISPRDLKNGLWGREFADHGFEIIEGAQTNDINALVRMRLLFEQFDVVTTNTWGSHVAYALHFGARVSLWGSCPTVDVETVLKLDAMWRADPESLRRARSRETEERMREFLREFHVPPADAAGNRELGSWLLGAAHRLSPHDMRCALTEEMIKPTRAPAVFSHANESSSEVTGDLPVVLVRSHEFNYSETFVEDHVNHLTKHLTLLYGYPFPRFLKGGRSVVSAACEQKLQAFARGGGTLTRELWEEYTAELAAFLKTCGARAALLESGLMASFVHEACERAALPHVVHFHGVDAFGRELLARWSGHYRKFFQRAASLAVVSRAMHAQLVKLGATPDRVQLAPYGVAIDLPAQANPAQAGPRFVAVGRFVEKKAPHLTLQAFAAVHREFPEARLTMVGDGVLLNPCQQWAAEHGLEGAVTFAGVQSRADVSRLMAASGIFVQHSITASTGDSEGLPLAVLEAGAHGLPVVSTRHAGIPDAVREGVDGFLVDEKDVAAMAAAMLRLARDPALAAKLGASFRGRIEARYSRRRSLERLHALLVAAAEGRSAAGLGEPLEETSAPAGESSGPLVTEVENAPAPAAAPLAEPPAPQDARGRIALDRNACDAYLELAAELVKQGALAEAYCAAGEAHRLAGDATHPRELLASLEEQGALGEPEVETYRRRAGWVPRRKSTHPRRILVVTNLLPPQEMGGYGRTMWEFSHELAARGHTVRVLTADMPHLLRKPSPEHAQFETQVRRVLRLCGDWKDGAAVTEPDLEKRRQAVKFNHQKILSFAKEFRPDVVMAGNLDFVGHFFMQELLDARIPVVHRLGNARPGYEAQHSPKSPLYCVAGGSEWVNERIRANGYNAGKFAVVPPGSPLTEYFRAFPPQRARLEIAFAGLLMPYKGAHVLVDALARLHRAGIAFRCTLAGDSTDPGYVEKLRAFARAQGFADRLQFPGFLSKGELAALYARANVLVFPTLVDEVFGKTQIEAMAAGLLVISTGSGGAREVIRDGVTGLLVKSDDAGALAEALARVQRDPARAEKIASAGQADAFRFTTATSVDRLEAVFQELIAPARRAAPRLTEYAA